MTCGAFGQKPRLFEILKVLNLVKVPVEYYCAGTREISKKSNGCLNRDY